MKKKYLAASAFSLLCCLLFLVFLFARDRHPNGFGEAEAVQLALQEYIGQAEKLGLKVVDGAPCVGGVERSSDYIAFDVYVFPKDQAGAILWVNASRHDFFGAKIYDVTHLILDAAIYDPLDEKRRLALSAAASGRWWETDFSGDSGLKTVSRCSFEKAPEMPN